MLEGEVLSPAAPKQSGMEERLQEGAETAVAKKGQPWAPYILVGNTLGRQRSGGTSFNPSLSEEVHAPLQVAPSPFLLAP